LVKVPPDCPNAVATLRDDCYERSPVFKLTDTLDISYTAPPGFKFGDVISIEVAMVVEADTQILDILSATLAPESTAWATQKEFSDERLKELAEKIFLGPGWVVVPAQNVWRDPAQPTQRGPVENVRSTATVTVELRLP
jgi:hypothetical protein